METHFGNKEPPAFNNGASAPSKRCRFTRLTGGEVVPFPSEVPMEYPIEHGGGMYIRACYPECYDIVNAYLDDNQSAERFAITVTGTPGIGKSVFGGYFYERFREEHPDAWIVLASFAGPRSPVMRVVCVKGGVVSKPIRGEIEATKAIEAMMNEAAAMDQRLVHLYDSAPIAVPDYGHLVCFARPIEAWLHHTETSSFFSKQLCMPLWTPEELHTAATALGLTAIKDEIDGRFAFFGGVARQALRMKTVHSEGDTFNIKSSIANITRMSQLRKLLSKDAINFVQYLNLVHLEPQGERKERMRPKFASPTIHALVIEQARHLSSTHAIKWPLWLGE